MKLKENKLKMLCQDSSWLGWWNLERAGKNQTKPKSSWKQMEKVTSRGTVIAITGFLILKKWRKEENEIKILCAEINVRSTTNSMSIRKYPPEYLSSERSCLPQMVGCWVSSMAEMAKEGFFFQNEQVSVKSRRGDRKAKISEWIERIVFLS